MNDTNFWNQDWMKAQQSYFDQWTDLSRQAMGMNVPKKSPWENAMDHWWQAVSPGMHESARGFMEKMLEQGKQYFRMSEQLGDQMKGGQDWSEALTNTLESMQRGFTKSADQAADATEKGYAQWMGLWEDPMDSWRKAAGEIPDIGGTGKNFEQLLGMPGLGYNREDEERFKAITQASLQYQNALQKYNQFFADLGMAAGNLMQHKIKELANKDEQIDSARGLYNLWVSCCEEEYAQLAISPEYSQIYGDLVNSLMALKKMSREWIDDRMGMFGMPTRRELRTLQTRLQESRRELRSMRSEMTELREQMDKLNSPKPAASKKKAAKAKTTVKRASKKAAKKPAAK